MAFVTYILLSAVIAGLRGEFQPELLGYTATTAFAIVIFEILGLKLGCYLLSISNESQVFDLLAYSGYKFVGIIVTVLVSEIISGGKGSAGWIGWCVFGYTFLANALFLVSSLLHSSRFRIPKLTLHSFAPSSMSCFQRTTSVEVPCTLLPALRRTDAPSSCSSTPTSFSSSSCGL